MHRILLSCFLVFVCLVAFSQKQVYIPNDWSKVNPYKTEWSMARSYQSENFICFWGAKEDTIPKTFNPQAICDTLEKSYYKYIKELKFCRDDTTTNLGKYKCIIVMNETWGAGGPTGWAFGGTFDDVIGAMWVHADACKDGGVVSHEFAHALQGMNYIQENEVGGGFVGFEPTGFIWEVHANFMRSQIYPKLVTDDLPRWLATRHFHWSSTRHHYDARNLLIHIQDVDSFGMVTRLWRESLAKEHPLETYRRIKDWNQDQLNDFVYDYAKCEVVFDYKSNNWGNYYRQQIAAYKSNEKHYLWRYYTILNPIDTLAGRYIVANEIAPQDYGFNIIPLYYDSVAGCDKREVFVKFKGHTEVNSRAGWRYGFVAVKNDSIARYSPVYGNNDDEVSFTLSDDETELYLVVVGAPSEHKTYVWEPGWPKIDRFPYEIKVRNAKPEGYQPNFLKEYKTNGKAHENGGGWVANTATVEPSVYVGPKAIVTGKARISGKVRIDGFAIVDGTTVKDSAVIEGCAHVWGGAVNGGAYVGGHAVLSSCTIREHAVVKGAALEWGVILKGYVVVAGDAEIANCAEGVYLQTPHGNNGRSACDGKDENHKSNTDVNKAYYPFFDAQMAFADSVTCGTSFYTIPADAGLYGIKAKYNGNFITVVDGSSTTGIGVNTAVYSDSAHQKFVFNKVDDYFIMQPLHANGMALRLTVSDNSAAKVVQLSPVDNTDEAQQWYFNPDGAGFYNIISKNDDWYLTVSVDGALSGSEMQQVSATTSDLQKFQIIPVLPETKIRTIIQDTFSNPEPSVDIAFHPAKKCNVIISPNPAIDEFNVFFDGFVETENLNLEIFDLKGSMLISQELGKLRSFRSNANVLRMKGNMFIVKVTGSNQVITRKLILIN